MPARARIEHFAHLGEGVLGPVGPVFTLLPFAVRKTPKREIAIDLRFIDEEGPHIFKFGREDSLGHGCSAHRQSVTIPVAGIERQGGQQFLLKHCNRATGGDVASLSDQSRRMLRSRASDPSTTD